MLKEALSHFENFKIITVYLQNYGLLLDEVRFIFDELLEGYPDMKIYLHFSSKCLKCQKFDGAIVKILSGDDRDLTEEKSN